MQTQAPGKHHPTPRRGVALLVTLGMIVLLSGIVLALLVSVRTDLSASRSYDGTTNARLLADSALNLVIAQIRDASTQPGITWISQPGLIRTFDAGGTPKKSYKLYSADSIVVDGSFDPVANASDGKGDLPPALGDNDPNNWKNQPNLWTDMNAPVADVSRNDPLDPSGRKRQMNYPIFDGGHLNSSGKLSLQSTDSEADIEGFTIESFATRGATMPVKWLYVLKDGTLATAKASGTNGDVEIIIPTGREKTAQGEDNTIVGRLAFWTDDETAKVNINTASEGTFWDTPVGNSQPGYDVIQLANGYKSSNESTFEWDFAEHQAAQKEYQRYPGHPATTCLSTVFGRQLMQTVGEDRSSMIEQINKLVPRVTGVEYYDNNFTSTKWDYSSKGGTKRAGPVGGRNNIGQLSSDPTTYPVTPDSDRLYATIDDFLFAPGFMSNRTPWTLAPAASDSRRDTTREMLEMSRFFLTTSSKAPEQNLFNQPRIAIWPIMRNSDRRTQFDKLLAFCSTLGPSGPNEMPFYFTRHNANHATEDLSPRNLWLMSYLKSLTGRPFPGWKANAAPAQNFQSKYGRDMNQILTEIFDYIRCINLVDRSDPNVNSSFTNSVEGPLGTVPPAGDSYTGQFPPSFDPNFPMGPRGQVIPIEMPDGTRGIGRIVTISELAMTMVRTADGKVEFSFLPMEFSPMAGFSALTLGLRLTFTKIDIKVTDASGSVLYPFYNDPTNAASGLASQPTLYDIGRMTQIEDSEIKLGGPMGFHGLCQETNGNRWPRNQGSPADSVPPTGVATVDLNGNMTVGGTVTVEISATARPTPKNTTGEPIVQVITFKFPDQSVPVPTDALIPPPPPDPTVGDGTTGSTRRGPLIAKSGAVNFGGRTTIRSLVPVGNNLQGDMRLIAARRTVDESYFAPAPNGAYTDSTRRNNRNSSLRNGWPGNTSGSAFGFLVDTITRYRADAQPCLPDGIRGVLNSQGYPGDWDNGPAFVTDGPYCNKPDEGTRRHLHGAGTRENYTEGTLWGNDFSAPYIGWFWNQQDAMQNQTTFFSPNRQIPSAVMFGSLPTGVLANKPWQTLLFRPAKSYLPGGTSHPGGAAWGPPDHLLLDLFWMPVVEPYAISEPFATSGKINLNQQIAPFTNIRRDTGLRAVLKSVKITAMNPDQPDRAGGVYSELYKLCGTPGNGGNAGGGRGVVVRRPIDLDNTLKQVTDRLDNNKPFISSSEICDIPLIPTDLPIVATMAAHVSVGFSPSTPLGSFDSLLANFWAQHKLTGDNSLERPYAHIYPRLTTRSNSYMVHVRVQTLKKTPTDPQKFIFKEGRDKVTGDFRGSFIIERYLDPNLAGFVNAAGEPVTPRTNGDTTGMTLGPYRFRIVSSKQFTP